MGPESPEIKNSEKSKRKYSDIGLLYAYNLKTAT